MIEMALAVALQSASDREAIGSWQFWERRDPITDEVRAGAGLVTDDGSFAIKCDEAGRGSVYFSFQPAGAFFGNGRSTVDRRPFVYRIDADPPVQVLWRYGDTSALLMDNPAPLAQALLTSERITLRGLTYRFAEVTRTFETAGADVAIPRVYAACADVMATGPA